MIGFFLFVQIKNGHRTLLIGSLDLFMTDAKAQVKEKEIRSADLLEK